MFFILFFIKKTPYLCRRNQQILSEIMIEKSETLVVQLTREQLVDAIREAVGLGLREDDNVNSKVKKHYVYGLQGIADLLGASKSTAARIKASGVLDPAISQQGKIIVCDADLAIDLLSVKNTRHAIRNRMSHRIVNKPRAIK